MARRPSSVRRAPGRLCGALAGLLGAAALVPGCGSPERRGGFDRMEFADPGELDDGVADSAVVVIGPPRPRPKQAQGRSGLPEPELSLPAPRCANQSERNGPSLSLGSVTAGSLESPCRLPASGPGYVSTNKNGYGTDETVALLQWAAQQVAQQFPGSPPLVIGAISRPEGGYYPPHKSHQSGRDVDLGYPRLDKAARQFQTTDAGSIDTERLWALLDAWLASGRLGFVFMDYDLQAVLYQDLLDGGYSEAQLEALFQYPAPRNVAKGLIRHAAGHADHLHVRFRCPDSDRPSCVD